MSMSEAISGFRTGTGIDKRVAVLNTAENRNQRIIDHLTRGKGLRQFLSALDGQPQYLDDWDEQAWNLLVSRVIIRRNGCVEFVFRGEITITVRAQ